MSDDMIKKPTLSVERIIEEVTGYLLNPKKEKYTFRFYEITEGMMVPIFISDGVAMVLQETQAITILKGISCKLKPAIEMSYKKSEMCFLTYHNAKMLYKTLMVNKSMQMLEKIKTFAFLSDPSITFCRIPFDLTLDQVASAGWDSFLENFTNTQALKMWVGSLFVEGSDRAQYLWMYGKGANGKSTLAKVIASVLGRFSRFEQVPQREDKYWTYGLLGKRLIVIDDCNNYGFVKTGLFKTTTGIGRVRVEKKFGDALDADLDCKFLFTSNEKPMVSNEIADQRRLIFCAAKNQDKFEYDPKFSSQLEAELPQFISNCVMLYSEHCSDGREIPVDQAEALELGEVFNEEVEAWIDTNFEYNPDGTVEVSKFRLAMGMTKLNDRRVYSFLESKGVVRKLVKRNGRVFKTIQGLSQKVIPIYNY